MAGFTLLRRGRVEEHRLAGDKFRQLMAISAADILMGAAQREIRPPVVVEERGLPLHRIVAVGAVGDFSLGKLLAVDIFVAIFALRGRGLEISVDQFGPEVRRLVTVHARGGAMSAQQRERGSRVIESGEFFP